MKSFQSTALLAVVAPLVSAHYNFDALIVDGVKTEPYQYVRALAPEAGTWNDRETFSFDIQHGS